MYTPPQDCLDTLLGSKAAPTKFFFGSSGFGLRERREKWSWKDQASKDLRDSHPTSYTYVIEDGHLATIADSANSSTTDLEHSASGYRSHVAPRTGSESDASHPLHSGPIIRRALSLTFSTQPRDELPMYRSATVSAMKSKVLPPLPSAAPKVASIPSRSSSTSSALPFADEFARYTAPGQTPSSSEFPQRLHYRRPDHLHYGTAPSSPPPTSHLPPTPRRSFEDPRKAPMPPQRSMSHRQHAPATPPPSPPAVSRGVSTKSARHSHKLSRGKTSKFTELLEGHVRPALKSPPLPPVSPFDMDDIPPLPYATRGLILPAPSPDSPHIAFAPLQPHAISKHVRVDSAMGSQCSGQNSAVTSARSSIEQRTSSEMSNLIGSKAATSIVQSKGFLVPALERTSSKLQKRGIRRQQSLPRIIATPYVRASTPAEDFMMSGGLAPIRATSVSTTGSRSYKQHLSSNASRASSVSSVGSEWPIYKPEYYESKPHLLPGVLPSRSASIASSRPISTLSQIPFVCTAEVMPVGLRSPVIAQGTARLISC